MYSICIVQHLETQLVGCFMNFLYYLRQKCNVSEKCQSSKASIVSASLYNLGVGVSKGHIVSALQYWSQTKAACFHAFKFTISTHTWTDGHSLSYSGLK